MLGLLEPMDGLLDNVVEYNRRGGSTNSSVGSGGGGGGVDDILKRLGNVETHVTELKSQFSALSATVSHLATAKSVSDLRSELTGKIDGISAIIPHLATAASVSDLKSELTGRIDGISAKLAGRIDGISAIIPHLATKADLADVKTAVASIESAIIKWIIATTLASAALAFTIAKFVH